MKYIVYLIIALMIFISGIAIGNHNTRTITDIDTLYVQNTSVSTITIPGKTVFVPSPVIHDTLMISDSIQFYTQFDTVFIGDHCSDSLSVTYYYPQNIFTVRNSLSNERLYIKEYVESPKKDIVRLCLNFDLTGNNKQYGSSIGASCIYKDYMLGLVVNTNKEAGIRLGYMLR